MSIDEFDIPSPGEVSEETSVLGKLEVAALTDGEYIKYSFQDFSEYLKKENLRLIKESEENRLEINKLRIEFEHSSSELKNKEIQLVGLRRGKVEIIIALILVTFAMTIGSTLISSYPNVGEETPWQFYFGWALIVAGILLSFFSRLLAWLIVYVKPRIFFKENK